MLRQILLNSVIFLSAAISCAFIAPADGNGGMPPQMFDVSPEAEPPGPEKDDDEYDYHTDYYDEELAPT
jgi:hypothetical protein